MKNRICPHCQQPLFNESAWELFKRSEYICSNCGKTCRLSMFGLNLIMLIFIAIIILAGHRLGYTVVALIICAVSIVAYLLLTAYWIPLIATSPAYAQTRNKQAQRESHKWYQTPVIWIALVVTAVVVWWNSLGLE